MPTSVASPQFFFIDITIKVIGKGVTLVERFNAWSSSVSTTENWGVVVLASKPKTDKKKGRKGEEEEKQKVQGCANVTVVFARGTCEPGNVGGRVGPWLLRALQETVGNGTEEVAMRGVWYGGWIRGFLDGGDREGGVLM